MTLNDLNHRWARFSFDRNTREEVYLEIRDLITNNVQLHQALKAVRDSYSDGGRKKDHPVAITLDAWLRSYKDNSSLGAAMAGWVPESERMLIQAGEFGGDLPGALTRAVEVSGTLSKMRMTFLGAIAYPAVLFAMAIGVLILFGVKVVPPFTDIVPVDRWTGMAAFMAFVSEMVRGYLPAVLTLLIALAGACFFSLSRWTGRLRIRFDRYPPWSMYRLMMGAGFLQSLAALIRAGVPLPDAMRRLETTANPWLKERLGTTLRYINSGDNLGVALKLAGFGFPDNKIINSLALLAELNDFDQALERISSSWLERGAKKMATISRSLNAAMLCIIAGIVIAMAAGMFSLQQQITALTSAPGF